MSRTYRALTTLALGLALTATATTAALATPPTGSHGSAGDVNAQREALYRSELAQNLKSSGDVNAQREALYRSELAQNLNNRTAGGTQAVKQARAGERNLGPAPVVTFAPQPVPAAPGRDVNLVAIALLALVGGLIGGVAAAAGWTAVSRRRHRVVAA